MSYPLHPPHRQQTPTDKYGAPASSLTAAGDVLREILHAYPMSRRRSRCWLGNSERERAVGCSLWTKMSQKTNAPVFSEAFAAAALVAACLAWFQPHTA